ncbi:unnamed protein product [Cylicocyclus nassatus]|uniref:Uncharacterized protein n=1 Tax=Cylicocyclus nassatus TaxID=53992 RepID=A0AA36DKZ7_CYLNA|nr:unnamed protein product [Cylicocyclus nassatus]
MCTLKTPGYGDCQICGQRGHGIHFGVLACRACAAFFRRTVVMKRPYTCRRADESCQISKDERYLCRLCRYKKCLKLGMTPENVQLNRDVLSTTVGKRISRKSRGHAEGASQSEEKNVKSTLNNMRKDGLTKGDNFSIWVKKTGQPRMLLDVSPIMEKLMKTLMESRPDEDLPSGPPDRMHIALLKIREHQLAEPNLKLVTTVSFEQMMKGWEEQICTMGKWLMNSDEFAQLPMKEKMTMIKTSWMIWQQFERLSISIELFGWRTVTERLLAVSSQNVMVHDKTMQFDLSPLTDYDPSYVRSLFEPFAGRVVEEVTKSCLEMGITTIEVAYILCALVWHVEGRSVAPETLLIAESYTESISDNLHSYYTNTRRMPNYAARLIKIMSIVDCIEKIYHERSKVTELAHIFDIFKTDVSEKGIFS